MDRFIFELVEVDHTNNAPVKSIASFNDLEAADKLAKLFYMKESRKKYSYEVRVYKTEEVGKIRLHDGDCRFRKEED